MDNQLHDLSKRQVITDQDDISILKDLHKLSKNTSEILEIICFDTFPNKKFPEMKLSPRQIIEYMMLMFAKTTQRNLMIPLLYPTLIYKYTIGAETCSAEFHYNMHLHVDIRIICYIYLVLSHEYLDNGRHKLKSCTPLRELMEMMQEKYMLFNDIQNSGSSDTISIMDIAYSYPSIVLHMFQNGIGCRANFLSITASFLDIPKVIFSPVINVIIPKLKNDPSMIFIAIATQLDAFKSENDSKTPLDCIYLKFWKYCNSLAFPKFFKVELCKRLQIIVDTPDKPEFHPSLIAHINRAKYLIEKCTKQKTIME